MRVVVSYPSNNTFCEHFEDAEKMYAKDNNNVSRLFLVQLLGIQIG